MELPLSPGTQEEGGLGAAGTRGKEGPGTARDTGEEGAQDCTGTQGGKGPRTAGTQGKGPGLHEGDTGGKGPRTAQGHGRNGARDFSSKPKGSQSDGHPPHSESTHLQAGQDEVHGFFWGKDLEEAITGQQNKLRHGEKHKWVLSKWPGLAEVTFGQLLKLNIFKTNLTSTDQLKLPKYFG